MKQISDCFFVPTVESTLDLGNRTLVMPCVSVGNVGQLATDLLISTLIRDKKATLIGRLSSSALRPVVGPNPFELSDAVMTTAEVYDSPSLNVTIVQVRSPCFHDKSQQFTNELVNWIKLSSFAKIVLLSSTYSQYLADQDPSESINPIRFLSSKFTLSNIKMKPVATVERYSHRPDANGIVYLPGSGLTRKLFSALEATGFSTFVLIKYCSEGDNTPDAFSLAETLNTIVQIKEPSKVTGRVSWDVPLSWNRLFGGDAPPNVY